MTRQRRAGRLRDDVRRRRARRAAALRGRLPHAGAGGQPRLGGAGAGPRARRRGPPAHGVTRGRARHARACTCGRRRRPTTAPASWPPPARRTGRSSRPTSSRPAAGARAARGRRRPGSALLLSVVAARAARAAAARRGRRGRRASIAAGVSHGRTPAAIKWPNDVLLATAEGEPARRKVAGILTEGRPQEGWAVLGIGVNVAVRLDELPPELRTTAATLGLEPRAVDDVRDAVLERACRGTVVSDRPTCSTPGASATRCSAASVSWAGGSGGPRASTAPAAWS